MAIYGYTKNYKLIKPQFNTDTWHDYIYDNLDTIDAVMSAIYASGNWKGFWAKNMTYVAGDVIIDRDTDTMYKVMIDHVTSMDTFAAEQTAHPNYYELWSPNNLAESWAIKTDGKVSNTDYSAKAYAISSGLIDDGSAKEWAIGSGAIGDTNEYSAKKYATDAHNDYISMTTNVNVVAVGSNIANVNAVGQSISNVDTVASNVASVNTVAGVSTDVTAVANVASSVPTVANNDANITTVATNISDVNTAATNIEAIKAAPAAATNAAQSATNAANSETASATSAQAAQDALNEVQGLIATPIGTIFQSVYVDESLDIARQLNGQLISSTKFTGFRSWLNTVQTAIPNLFTTETNWQAEKALSKFGQVGKFVIDDTAQTIRLPAVVNAQGLLSLSGIGNLVNESLPNISGDASLGAAGQNSLIVGHWSGTGFFSTRETTDGPVVSSGGTTTGATHRFLTADASRSSSTYQNGAPVQQEAVQYPYYIQVATGVEETLPAIREYNINTPFFFGQSMYSDVAPDNASWLASNGSYNARSVYPDYYDWLVEQMNAGVSGFLNSVMYAYSPSGSGIIFTLPTLTPKVGMTCYGYSDGSYENIPLSVITSVAGDGSFQAEFQGTNYVFVRNPEKDQTTVYPTDYDFVINTTDQTFRLPLLNGSEDLPGDRYENLTYTSDKTYIAPANGWFSCYGTTTGASASSYNLLINNTTGERDTKYSFTSNTRLDVSLEVSRGQSVYTLSQNLTIEDFRFIYAQGNGSLYFYVGDTVQDASLINAGAVLGQLSNKADIDASNFNADGKSLLSGLGMPSGKYVDLTLGASGTTYTAPANGYLFLSKTATAVGQYIALLKSYYQEGATAGVSSETLRRGIQLLKGESVKVSYSVAGSTNYFRFIYAEGENNV